MYPRNGADMRSLPDFRGCEEHRTVGLTCQEAADIEQPAPEPAPRKIHGGYGFHSIARIFFIIHIVRKIVNKTIWIGSEARRRG